MSSTNENPSVAKNVINWYPGHMAKTKRLVKENLGLIDIVFEVIDARIPYSSKNKDIDELIQNKPRILIMTKKDLCDIEVTWEWVKYYEDKGYKVVLVDLINNPNLKELLSITSDLSKELNNKRKEKGLKERKTRILILGTPNAGKSTLINRLVGKKATNVGNRPGVTKNLEWIRINNELELLDTPGILPPKLENNNMALNLASMTAIKEEILDTEEIAIHIITMLKNYYKDYLEERYKLTDEEDIVDILDKIGKNIGAIRGGETDYEKVYATIIRDLKEGRIGKVTFDRVSLIEEKK